MGRRCFRYLVANYGRHLVLSRRRSQGDTVRDTTMRNITQVRHSIAHRPDAEQQIAWRFSYELRRPVKVVAYIDGNDLYIVDDNVPITHPVIKAKDYLK